MATYLALSDDPYSNWSEGRGFAYTAVAAAVVGLTGWAATRGYLPGLRPADASDQLLIAAVAWVGGGLFMLMAICASVVMAQAARSRGTVTLDDAGVVRQIGKQRWMLRWEEIEGIVTMGQEGATLIPRGGRRRIEIPASLDDLRGCIAEIKAKGIVSLPQDALSPDYQRRRRKRAWWQLAVVYTAAFLSTYDTHASHASTVARICFWAALFIWVMVEDRWREGHRWLDWFSLSCLFGWVAWVAYHAAHTW